METITLYKLKAASNLEHALDIVINNRLYCADFRELNDPLEAYFNFISMAPKDKLKDDEELLFELEPHERQDIVECLSKYRVASLTDAKGIKSRLMWAHYASAFSGLAVEIELPRSKVHIVDYENPAQLDTLEAIGKNARNILSHKHKDWGIEFEWRVIHCGRYFDLPEDSIKGVIVGQASGNLFKIMSEICRPRGIEVRKSTLGYDGVSFPSQFGYKRLAALLNHTNLE